MAPKVFEPESLRKLLEQHWLHCRHLERERAWFMSVYAAITGGVLVFMARNGLQNFNGLEQRWPLYFLVVLTFFGFFLTVRWTYTFECHRERVNSFARLILSKLPEDELPPGINPTMDIQPMELGKFTVRSKTYEIRKIFRTRYWFPAFYFIVLVVLALISPPPIKYWAIGCSLVALGIFVGYLRSKPG